MIRTKGEAGTGDVVHAVKHLREVHREMRMLTQLSKDELMAAAKRLQAPYELVVEVAETGKLPVPNFAAGGIATPADAALCMPLGAEAVFVGSGIFKSDDPENRARAIVKATTHWRDAEALLEAEESLGSGHEGHRGGEPARGGPAPDARMVRSRDARAPGRRGSRRPRAAGRLRGAPAGARGDRRRELRGPTARATSRAPAGLIIPGGESTTLWKFFEARALGGGVRASSRRAAGPILGTCAGAIVLAREVTNPAQKGLGLIDIADRAQRLRPAGRFVRRRRRCAGARSAAARRSSSARRGSAGSGPGVEVLATPPRRAGARAPGQRRGGDVSPGADDRPAAPRGCCSSRTAGAEEERVSLVRAERRDESRGPDPRPPEGQRLLAGARRGALGGPRRERGRSRRRPGLGAAGHVLGGLGPQRSSSTATAPAMEEFVAAYCDLVRQLFVFGPPLVAALPGPRHRRRPHRRDGRRRADRRGGQGQVRALGGDPRRVRPAVPDGALPPRRRSAAHGAARGDRRERHASRRRDRSGSSTGSFRPGSCSTAPSSASASSPGLRPPAYAAIKLRSRAAAIARFDQARDHDPFLDFWFSEDARFRG